MSILNLAQYVNLFSTCLVNLLNYEHLDLPPLPIPVWTSRYRTVQFCTITQSLGEDISPYYKIFLQDPGSNTTIPDGCLPDEVKTNPLTNPLRTNKFQQKGWKCLTRFYIFLSPGLINLPPAEHEESFFRTIRKNEQSYNRVGYHVLVDDGLDPEIRSGWNSDLNGGPFEDDAIIMMLFWADKKAQSIIRVEFCCRYCIQFFKVCMPYETERGQNYTGLRNFIEEGSSHFNRINNNITTYIVDYDVVLGMKYANHKYLD